jgi:hypothetical protein
MHLLTIVPAEPDPWPEQPSAPCVPLRRAQPLRVRVESGLTLHHPQS